MDGSRVVVVGYLAGERMAGRAGRRIGGIERSNWIVVVGDGVGEVVEGRSRSKLPSRERLMVTLEWELFVEEN